MPEGVFPSSTRQNGTIATPRVDSVYLDADDMIMSRDIRNAIDPTFEDNDFITFIEGDSRLVKASKFYNYETGKLFRPALIGTITAGTAQSATITLDASAYLTVNELTGAANRSPIIEGDLVPLSSDLYVRVNAKTGSGTATTYTLQRVGNVGDVGAALANLKANNWPIISQGNAFGEGTNMPTEFLDTPAQRFVGQFQIIKSFNKITGDAASHQMSLSWGGKTYYWDKMKADMLKRHRIYQNLTLMFGPGGSVSDGVQMVSLTNSVRSLLKAHGNQVFYNKSTGITFAILDKIAAAVKQEGYTEALFFSGSKPRLQIEDLLATRTGNGGIVYSTGDKDGQRSVDFGFGEFYYHGVRFKLQEYRVHADLMGQAYMSYDDEAYIMPAGKMNVVQPNGPSGAPSISINALTVCYKQQGNGVNRRVIDVTQDINTLAGMNDSIQHGLQTQEGVQLVQVRKGFFVSPLVA